MAEDLIARSALSHLGEPALAEGGGVQLRELPRSGKLILRGDPERDNFAATVRRALDIELPLAPNTSSETEPLSALWLGPDEWLLVCAGGSEDTVAATLREALAGQHAAAVDVSDARCVLRLSGAALREVLAQGCALDLHPREFALGDVAQTQLAKADVILHYAAEEGPAIDIYVARSFADYLWRWLAAAIALI